MQKKIVYRYKYKKRNPFLVSKNHFVHISGVNVYNAAAKSLQSCPTLCDPIDGSPPGSPVPGILQARTLEWVVISFSNAWKWKVKVKSLSRVRLCVTPRTATYQGPPSMGFSRQEYWSVVPLPSPILKATWPQNWKTLTFTQYFFSKFLVKHQEINQKSVKIL